MLFIVYNIFHHHVKCISFLDARNLHPCAKINSRNIGENVVVVAGCRVVLPKETAEIKSNNLGSFNLFVVYKTSRITHTAV